MHHINKITTTITQTLASLPATSHIWVAYSGGIDSQVLLHAIAQARQDFPRLSISAVHINHGLMADADQWEKHCQTTCRQLKINYLLKKITVPHIKGESPEETARKARYAAFTTILKKHDYLFTAHHQDDQAETYLLQLLRGAGAKGLASMPVQIPFAKGLLCRPFLSISRAQIVDYAQQQQLTWVEDQSNHDTKFMRNFLRHEIMPLLQKKFPNAIHTIARSAEHNATTEQLLQEYAAQDLEQLDIEKYDGLYFYLDIEELKKLTVPRQMNLLRYWIHQQKFLMPSTIKLQHIINDVINSSEDAQPLVSWENAEVRRYKNRLCLMRPLPPLDQQPITWHIANKLTLPNNLGTLSARKTKGVGLYLGNKKTITVKFRHGGEKCKLIGRKGTKELKKLFQEWDIPTWLRDRIPLIFIGKELAAIANYAICEPFSAKKNQTGWEIINNVKTPY